MTTQREQLANHYAKEHAPEGLICPTRYYAYLAGYDAATERARVLVSENEALWDVVQEIEEYLGIGRTFLCSDHPLVKALGRLDKALAAFEAGGGER